MLGAESAKLGFGAAHRRTPLFHPTSGVGCGRRAAAGATARMLGQRIPCCCPYLHPPTCFLIGIMRADGRPGWSSHSMDAADCARGVPARSHAHSVCHSKRWADIGGGDGGALQLQPQHEAGLGLVQSVFRVAAATARDRTLPCLCHPVGVRDRGATNERSGVARLALVFGLPNQKAGMPGCATRRKGERGRVPIAPQGAGAAAKSKAAHPRPCEALCWIEVAPERRPNGVHAASERRESAAERRSSGAALEGQGRAPERRQSGAARVAPSKAPEGHHRSA